MSKRAVGMALGHRMHGRDRAADFYTYVSLTRREHREMLVTGAQVGAWRRADGSALPERSTDRWGIYRDPSDVRDDDRAWFEVPCRPTRIACWACHGSGFNCSSEMARLIEQRCHTGVTG